jgi:hypothetical protein
MKLKLRFQYNKLDLMLIINLVLQKTKISV